MNPKTVISQISGGLGSFYALKLAGEEHPDADHVGVFADVNIEDADTYRTVWHAIELLAERGGRAHVVNEGLTPFDVYRQVRFIGNSRVDPCSYHLKRKPIRQWLDRTGLDPEETVIVLGFDWTEEHRLERARAYWHPWRVDAPLVRDTRQKADLLEEHRARYGYVPELYGHRFPHSNCSGFCCKAGARQFETLLRIRPRVYAEAEQHEEGLRADLGDHSFLKRTRGGETRPLSLRELRTEIESRPTLFDYEDGSCSCFDPVEGVEIPELPERDPGALADLTRLIGRTFGE